MAFLNCGSLLWLWYTEELHSSLKPFSNKRIGLPNFSERSDKTGSGACRRPRSPRSSRSGSGRGKGPTCRNKRLKMLDCTSSSNISNKTFKIAFQVFIYSPKFGF